MAMATFPDSFQFTLWFQNTAMTSAILRPWSPPLEPVLSDTSAQTPGQGSLCIHLPRLQRTSKTGRWASHQEDPAFRAPDVCTHSSMPMFWMSFLWEGILWVTKGNTSGRAVNTESTALEAFTTVTGEGGRVWRQHTDLGRLRERPNTEVLYYVLMWCTVDSNDLSTPCSLHSNLIEKSPHHKDSLPQTKSSPYFLLTSVGFLFPASWWK